MGALAHRIPEKYLRISAMTFATALLVGITFWEMDARLLPAAVAIEAPRAHSIEVAKIEAPIAHSPEVAKTKTSSAPSSYSDIFDEIYVITVPSRLEAVEKLHEKGIPAKLHNATLSDLIDTDKLVKDGVIDEKMKHTRVSNVAVALSHLSALERFVKETSGETLLIFEDDIHYNFNAGEAMRKIISAYEHLPDDWDVWYLGRCFGQCDKDLVVAGGLVQCFSQACGHAWAWTRKAAQIMLNAAFPITDSVDEFARGLIRSRNLTSYCMHPSIFIQDRMTYGSLRTNRFKLGDMPECRGQ